MTECPHRSVTGATRCYPECPLYTFGRRCAKEFGLNQRVSAETCLDRAITHWESHQRDYALWWLEASNYAGGDT